jgi:hypothetical protein
MDGECRGGIHVERRPGRRVLLRQIDAKAVGDAFRQIGIDIEEIADHARIP